MTHRAMTNQAVTKKDTTHHHATGNRTTRAPIHARQQSSHPQRSKAATLALLATLSLLPFSHRAQADTQPSIDDLLGLTPPAPGSTPGSNPGKTPGAPTPASPVRPAQPDSPDKANVNINPDVTRKLSNQDSSDAFEAAVLQMDDVVKMLAQLRDASPQTQRTQQDILAKLDQVIATARKQPQPPGSGDGEGDPDSDSQPSPSDQPSSSGDRGSQQNQSNSGKQPGNPENSPGNSQKNNQASPAGQQPGKPNTPNGNQSDPNNTTPGGAPRNASDSSPLKSSRTEWGNLPPRVREQLLEGMSERFSPVYQEMTESYYKRLGKEGQP